MGVPAEGAQAVLGARANPRDCPVPRFQARPPWVAQVKRWARNVLMRPAIALLLILGGIAGSLRLLAEHHVGEATFLGLVGLSVFAAALVFFSDRLREFSVKEMKVVLGEMRETQHDIREREKKIQETAQLVGDLITYVEATAIGTSGSKARDEWLKRKIESLGTLAGGRIDNPFWRFSQRLSARDPKDEERLKSIWAQLEQEIEEDLARLQK